MNQKSRDMLFRTLMLILCFPLPKKKIYAAVAPNSEKYFNPVYKIKAIGLSNRDKYNPEKDNIPKNRS